MTATRSPGPTGELLLTCAKGHLRPDQAERIPALILQDLDWGKLLTMASYHRLVPLLYYQLNAACPDLVPASRMHYLRDYFEQNARKNLFYSAELLRILGQFQTDQVLVIPYKGPTLAVGVYGHLGFRDFSDLDVLVPQRDIPKAQESLLALGYCPEFCSNRPARYHGEYPFRSRDRALLLELHSERTLRHFPKPINIDRLAERAGSLSIGRQSVPDLSPEDMLILLCVHGAKDFWERLAWVVDVAELLRCRPQMDWARVWEESISLRTERIVRSALFLASKLLDASVPEEFVRRAQADTTAKWLEGQVYDRLIHADYRHRNLLQKCAFRIRMGRNVGEGLRHCVRLAMTRPNNILSS